MVVIPVNSGSVQHFNSFRMKCLLWWLCYLLVVVIIIIACLIILLVKYYNLPSETELLIIAKMDRSVDPCQDFYTYACGGFHENPVVKKSDQEWSFLTYLMSASINNVTKLLQQPNSPEDLLYETQARRFYSVCLDTERLKARGTAPFFSFLKSFGKFPILDPTWEEADFNLQDIITKLARLGFATLFTVTALPVEGTRMLSILTPTLQVMSDMGRTYVNWTTNTLSLLGVDVKRSEIVKEIDDMFRVEKDLNELLEKIKKLLDREDIDFLNLMNISMLQQSVPKFNWLKFFQDVTSGQLPDKYVITEKEIVLVSNPPALTLLLNTVVEYSNTRAVANFFMKTLLMFTAGLHTNFTSVAGYEYAKFSAGGKPINRSLRCVLETQSIFPEPVGRMYVDEFYVDSITTHIKEITSDLKAAYKDIFNQTTWLSATSKQRAIQKLDAMQEWIGYHQSLRDNNLLNNLYKSIPLDEYFEIGPALARLWFGNMMRTLGKKLKIIPKIMPFKPGAFYLNNNAFVVPASTLQYPTYSYSWPSAINYGTIGTIIGHEINHAFDTNGRMFNETGDQESWFTSQENDTFNKQDECFINQYNKYKYQNIQIDGLQTLKENLADNGGIRGAFKAFQNYLKRSGNKGPGFEELDVDNNQLFFLAYAQVWCHKIPQKSLTPGMNLTHAPGQTRVMGTLQNSEEFSNAFNCKPGSPMNPSSKCKFF